MNTSETNNYNKQLRRHYHNHDHKLRNSPSLKFHKNPSSSSSPHDYVPDFYNLQYTSLRDLTDGEGNNFNIHNKHRRVRSEGSTAYRHPSDYILLADQNQSCFVSFWEELNRKKAALCSCLRVYVRDPLRACFRPIVRFFLRIVQ